MIFLKKDNSAFKAAIKKFPIGGKGRRQNALPEVGHPRASYEKALLLVDAKSGSAKMVPKTDLHWQILMHWGITLEKTVPGGFWIHSRVQGWGQHPGRKINKNKVAPTYRDLGVGDLLPPLGASQL